MYLRTTSRTNKDGSVVRYLALAHNERVGGTARAKVLLNLGREDQLDQDGLRRLVSSLSRYLGDPDPYADPDADPVAGLRLSSSRQLGGVHLLDGLWHQLGIDTALRELLGERKFTTDVERVLFALVARLCQALGVTQSMGAVGTSADNALAESFNATLKREVLQDEACWTDEATCRRQVFRWILHYNTGRRHSYCGYQSPSTYETHHAATLKLTS